MICPKTQNTCHERCISLLLCREADVRQRHAATPCIRIRWEKRGGHIHCRLFTAPARNQTFANCGNLCFDEREWPGVQTQLIAAGVEFLEDVA